MSLITLGLGGADLGPNLGTVQVQLLENQTSYLRLTFSLPINTQVVDTPVSEFAITTTTGNPIKVTKLELESPNQLRLYTEEQTTGATYTLELPRVGIVSVTGNPLNTPYKFTFTGQGVPPVFAMVRPVDARTLHVIFSEAVLESDATNISNYTITPTLSVFSATKITDRHYELKTSKQNELTTYSVEISNIRDLAQNPIEP